MVIKNKKTVVIILICVLVISLGIAGILYLMNDRSYNTLENGEDEMTLLTEEQNQLLKDSIFHGQFEQMNEIERKSAWLILNAMAEINFIENTYPGESGVANAVRVLGLLGIETIEEITIVRVNEDVDDLARTFVARIINEKNEPYYILYNRTWNLEMVTKGSERGEIIYSSATHIIIDGQVRLRRGFENMVF